MKHTTVYTVILIFLNVISSCNKDGLQDDLSGCDLEDLLETFITPDGLEVFINNDGTAYTINDGICTFAVQYFDPDFLTDNYLTNESGTFIITDDGDLFPTKSNFVEDFENFGKFTDLFLSSVADTNLYWTSFTLLSPSAPEVDDYVALRKCILEETCTFIDNRIDLVNDPSDASNQVLKFTSVAPDDQMVTAKSSISSSLNFYTKNSEVWYQADYYIVSGMPFSLVDFENSYFSQSPGPRVVIRNNQLSIENKFGAKLNFTHNSGISVPQEKWFTIKVHLKYSNVQDGILELWQDGTLLFSTTGINLPTSNSVQNGLEAGITATPTGCILLFDNMRISDTAF